MRPADLAAVEPLGNSIHLDHPEDAEIFAERLALSPAGCHVLHGPTGLAGYVISHPWHADDPPALNTLLATLPACPATWYIHDLALHPSARGSGAAAAIVAHLAAHARAIDIIRMDLIAVGASPTFWSRQGFAPAALPAAKLASYGAAARFMIRSLESA